MAKNILIGALVLFSFLLFVCCASTRGSVLPDLGTRASEVAGNISSTGTAIDSTIAAITNIADTVSDADKTNSEATGVLDDVITGSGASENLAGEIRGIVNRVLKRGQYRGASGDQKTP